MKKWITIVLSIIVILGILAVSFEPLVLKYMRPSDSFENTEAPAPPDYKDDYFWFASPYKKDTSDLIPPNVDTSFDLADKPVDVFFIHPTGYFGPGEWNSTMEADKSAAQATEFMLASIASPFNGCCRIFAPHFREAHIHAFTTEDRQSGNQALDLAYQDVAKAFDYYLANENNGRPIILVGHSQGALIGKRLLQSHFDGKPLAEQLVAAYIIGYWLQVERLVKDLDTIGLCINASQTGCIVSYDTYVKGGFKEGSIPIYKKDKWGINESGASVCINPLSWSNTLDKVEAEQHLGALAFEFLRTRTDMLLDKNAGKKYSTLNPLVENFSSAQCQEDGRLEIQVPEDSPFYGLVNKENKNMHVVDFGMFYGNIRKNAIDRSVAKLNTL